MLAPSRDDVAQLNTRARAHSIDHGDVRGDPLLSAGDREWGAGNRLRVTRNERRIPVATDYLRSGDIFTVIASNERGLTVQRLRTADVAVLSRDYLAEHAAYGWACTIGAAQGATVDHSLLLARPGFDRTRLYVAMTRGVKPTSSTSHWS